MIKIKIPKGTLYIGKEDVPLEDIQMINKTIENVSFLTVANTVDIAVIGLLGLTAVITAVDSTIKTRKLAKRVSELENEKEEV